MPAPPIKPEQIRATIDALPRIRWSHTPTPLEEWTALRRALGGPRLLVKRDDTTGLAYGGNKVRHFEFVMAEVLAQGCDTLIVINNFHSNHARVAAAACVKAGIRYILISVDEAERAPQGNLLLVKLMGGEIHRLGPQEDAMACAEAVAETVRSEGGKPYLLNKESFPRITGTIAFVEAGLELRSQLASIGVERIHLWGLVGASLPGLRLLARNLDLDWSASMVIYSPGDTDAIRQGVVRRSEQAAQFLRLPVSLGPQDIEIIDGFSGAAYAAPTDAAFAAIHLVASTEAVILDPNYTGKSMSALIDRIRCGGFSEDDTVVFLHSGGLPQLFAFNEELAAWSPPAD
jgi:1-aminocyclopropane-1-carboxylate deaminase/D-cysteine desulfhydrase-like pyridoxal-dependent ACC family enzyme